MDKRLVLVQKGGWDYITLADSIEEAERIVKEHLQTDDIAGSRTMIGKERLELKYPGTQKRDVKKADTWLALHLLNKSESQVLDVQDVKLHQTI